MCIIKQMIYDLICMGGMTLHMRMEYDSSNIITIRVIPHNPGLYFSYRVQYI